MKQFKDMATEGLEEISDAIDHGCALLGAAKRLAGTDEGLLAVLSEIGAALENAGGAAEALRQAAA